MHSVHAGVTTDKAELRWCSERISGIIPDVG